MSPFLPLHKKSGAQGQSSQRSFALVITLALVAVATILLILFVTAMSLDRSASSSYSQSVKAQEIGLGGLHLVVAQLQAEMSKDALPDTNNSATAITIFTNVTMANMNIAPQANVTNSAIPTLVKMSNPTVPFYSGTLSSGALQATTNSTTTSSYNGRSVSTSRWNQAYFGTFANSAVAPTWLLMTRDGPTNASGIGFGTVGATLNNSLATNTSYVIGRVAYAVYDESGLLDITAAGYNTNVISSTSQMQPIKGTLAGADLGQLGIDPMKFVAWRNAVTGTSTTSYLNYVTNFASTNGFQQTYPGDTTFLGRQDLIAAAQNSATTGIPLSALTNLTTFTRELNAPSWAPGLNGGGTAKYNYANNATTLTNSTYFTSYTSNRNPNPLVPLVRYTSGGTVTGYLASGAPYTYTVNAGDPVVQHRFPLDRLNWIGPNGPNSAAFGSSVTATQRAAAIKACFGLVWGAADNTEADPNWQTSSGASNLNVWRYAGSALTTLSGSTELLSSGATVSAVETLTDVGSESPVSVAGVSSVREPNFFELLQAGTLYGSLGLTLGNLGGGSAFSADSDEQFVSLHLFRIGANILTQAQAGQAYPINIEYHQKVALSTYSYVASGVANLPYLNVVKFVTGRPASDPNIGTNPLRTMNVFGLFGLWNPHQQSATAPTRPPVRLYIQGSISVGSGWAKGATGYTSTGYGASTSAVYSSTALTTGSGSVYGTTHTLPVNKYYIQLATSSGAGASGFLNPYAISTSDVASTDGMTGTGTMAGWTSSPSNMVSSADPEGASFTYEAFELPDLSLNLGQAGGPGTSATPDATHDVVYLNGLSGGSTVANPNFQIILKYQDGTGNWVPYSYFSGINSPSTWNTGTSGLRDCFWGTAFTSSTYSTPSLDDVLHSNNYHSATMFISDPRSIRFGFVGYSGDLNSGMGTIQYPMTDSLWSGGSHTTSPFNVSGYGSGSGTGLPGEGGSVPALFGSAFYLPADLSRNNYPTTSGGGTAGGYFTSYKDTDGIQRIADSGLFTTSLPFTAAPTTGNPFYDPNNTVTIGTGQRTGDRPIILNRPLASVGELGYTFRDIPWRSLDFFSVNSTGTSTSADSGLLDLFTVTDSPNTVVAGRVNLNTQNTAVLQAILSGTQADSIGKTLSSPYNLSNPSAMAATLAAYTLTNPLANKDQLVTKFNPTLPYGSTAASPFNTSSTDEQNVKPFREAFIRSLADVGQTRTWNLMIDLIAQAGKYPPNATNKDQFVVEGERRYWLHVAIDRITGKVIDQRLEVVAP